MFQGSATRLQRLSNKKSHAKNAGLPRYIRVKWLGE